MQQLMQKETTILYNVNANVTETQTESKRNDDRESENAKCTMNESFKRLTV